jgi:tetratricopeptide (TPR) repeat protein
MPAGGAEEVYAAWRTLFERIAEHGPTVLVFEDLHWADPGLLDFIEGLATSARHRPILILTLARPELLERRPTWGAGIRRLTTIELGPLPADAMDMLLLGIVPGIPPVAIRAIRDHSEGIPLYAVETVRMLLDKGSLTEQDGRYRLSGELGSLAVPESLTGLLGARIDGVSEREREVLGHAAVLGQVFDVTVLEKVAGLAPDDIRGAVDDLAAREIVELDDDPRSPTRGQYRFVQGLMREVVYGRLSRRERTSRHLAIAHELEAREGDELAGVVASHYLDAWRSAPAEEAPVIAGHARQALTAAASRAAALGAVDRALGYTLDSEQLASGEDERLAAGEAVLAMAIRASRHSIVTERAPALEADYVRRGDLEGATRVAAWRGQSAINDGRPDQAMALLELAVDRVGSSIESEATARLAAELARSYLVGGQTDQALPIIEAALPVAERLDLRGVIAELLPSKGWALAASGRTQEAAAIHTGAVAFAEREGLFDSEVRARMNLSAVLAAEDPARAFAVAAAGFERAAELGYPRWMATLFSNAAGSAVAIGEWGWAIEAMARFDPAEASGGWLGLRHVVAAEIAANQGDVDAAQSALNAYRAGLGDRPDPQLRKNLAFVEAELALCRGDLKTALRRGEVAAGMAVSHAMQEWIFAGRMAVWLGDLAAVDRILESALASDWITGRDFRAQVEGLTGSRHALAGDEPTAIAAYEGAARTLRGLGARFELALVLLDRVLLLPDAPGRSEAAAEARSILEPLGARPFLDRLDAALGISGGTASTPPDWADKTTPTPSASQAVSPPS